ncbi:MAG: hypothetical protein PSX36_10475 [bacterium]|nr:hypothetical protein [bacterium]
MMKEGVIITKINIKRQGERKHFQIKLPNDTKFIIGVEYGGRLISKSDVVKFAAAEIAAPPIKSPVLETWHTAIDTVVVGERSKGLFKRNQLVGELKLQSSEESNWFYSTDVFVADANLSYGDFSNAGFKVNDFTHGNKRTEEFVKVDAESTIIQGWYLDALGKSQKVDINYEVTIYVWINVEE